MASFTLTYTTHKLTCVMAYTNSHTFVPSTYTNARKHTITFLHSQISFITFILWILPGIYGYVKVHAKQSRDFWMSALSIIMVSVSKLVSAIEKQVHAFYVIYIFYYDGLKAYTAWNIINLLKVLLKYYFSSLLILSLLFLSSHRSPLKPVWQIHWASTPVLRQTPLLRHGFGEHGVARYNEDTMMLIY